MWGPSRTSWTTKPRRVGSGQGGEDGVEGVAGHLQETVDRNGQHPSNRSRTAQRASVAATDAVVDADARATTVSVTTTPGPGRGGLEQ